MFLLKVLDEATRRHMLDEANLDGAHATEYFARRLTEQGRKDWPELLRTAIREGTPETLAESLREPGRMKTTETSHRKGNPYEKPVPKEAAELLAEGEFNRYYCRAICLRALEEGRKVRVYRGRHSDHPRPESDAWIGKYVDARALLEDVRSNPGGDPAPGVPSVNTGLTVYLE